MRKKKGAFAIGTTKRGIGPCYADKASRVGIRICELINPSLLEKRLRTLIPLKNLEIQGIFKQPSLDFEVIFKEYTQYGQQLAPYVSDVEQVVGKACRENKNILFEGAQGTLLDINFGTYPYVAAPLSLMLGVLYPTAHQGIPQEGRLWLVYLILVTKITDVGAYFVGRLWGKKQAIASS